MASIDAAPKYSRRAVREARDRRYPLLGRLLDRASEICKCAASTDQQRLN